MDLRLLRYFVAVAEELHFGRAADRLHLSQPSLSRAVRQLETDLGVVLLRRSPAGVELTGAGTVLYREARTLLGQAEHARARVTASVQARVLIVGTLADSAQQAGPALVTRFRSLHPGADVRVREADLIDPTMGLRSGQVDLALTRAPFDDAGISIHVLRHDPLGVVLRTGDPLTRREVLHLADLAGRRWFQFPEGTDPIWRDFWNASGSGGPPRDGPVVRTIHECQQAVLWNGTIGLAPLADPIPPGLTVIPLADVPPSRLVVAWQTEADADPLIRSFVRVAADVYRQARVVTR